MLDDNIYSESRFKKLEKQRDVHRRKQKEKHASQILSLHALSDYPDDPQGRLCSSAASRRLMQTPVKDTGDSHSLFAYDGPQAFDLNNTDDLPHLEPQWIRVHEGVPSNGDQNDPTSFLSHWNSRIDNYGQEIDGVLTRSTTLMSSMDQDALILSASELLEECDGENDETFRTAPDPLINPVLSADACADTCPLVENLQCTTDVASVVLHLPPVHRTVDWTTAPQAELLEEKTPMSKHSDSLASIASTDDGNEGVLPDGPSSEDAVSQDHSQSARTSCFIQPDRRIPPTKLLAPAPLSKRRSRTSKTESKRPSAIDSRQGTESSDTSELVREVLAHLNRFVINPAPKSVTIRCQITRDKHGLDRGIYPTYYLHMEHERRKFFLLAARRRKRSATSNYVISCDATDLSRHARSFTGKLRSNFLGTQFSIFVRPKHYHSISGSTYSAYSNHSRCDEDDNASNFEKDPLIPDHSLKEVAAVLYDTNVLGFKGPRKMTVLIPRLSDCKDLTDYIPPEKTLIESWREQLTDNDLLALHNRHPIWNEETQSYVLNFYGRVTQASVKNFQIVDSSDPGYVIMQFGRVAEDTFSMDYAYPMCALQAFGIALSSFDGKLACE